MYAGKAEAALMRDYYEGLVKKTKLKIKLLEEAGEEEINAISKNEGLTAHSIALIEDIFAVIKEEQEELDKFIDYYTKAKEEVAIFEEQEEMNWHNGQRTMAMTASLSRMLLTLLEEKARSVTIISSLVRTR